MMLSSLLLTVAMVSPLVMAEAEVSSEFEAEFM